MALELHNALKPLPLPFFLFFFFFIFYSTYHARLIRKKYSEASLFGVDMCPLCGKPLTGEKTTNNLFFFPYLFKTLRHYEKYHLDIASHAKRARILASISLNALIFGIIFALVLRSLDPIVAELSLEMYIWYFISGFLGASLFFWLLIALFLYKILPRGIQSDQPTCKAIQ